ncbi:MAG TPA: pirin family protein [Burkholderiaceae bacterium]|nr:pirin family protein [Burkholderiaceae bacterium]
MKRVIGIYGNAHSHWVGDGFPVRTLFSYSAQGAQISPFLLLDYAGPKQFEPATHRRGVGAHPHRGFETVTLVYQGEVEHRDSTGAGGRIGPGDVQWMTAGAGVLHEEFHSQAFTRSGGVFEAVQLWVNLPARDKGTPAAYQTLLNADIPVAELPGGAGRLRVIAGAYAGLRGPARTFTPMNVWDVRLAQGQTLSADVGAGNHALVVVLHGAAQVNGSALLNEAQWVALAREGEQVHIEARQTLTALLLSGEPIDEPIAGYGPFVMNHPEEIETALRDLRDGRFGELVTSPASADAEDASAAGR